MEGLSGAGLLKATQTLSLTDVQGRSTAARWLKQGKLVAIPTETVYGLAASAANGDAVKGVFTAKGRPLDHPLILHVATVEQLDGWVAHISDQARTLMDAFWPGPLTLILPRHPEASDLITAGKDTIAVRMPADPLLREILSNCGPVVAPSANPHKKISPTSARQVLQGLDGRIDAVVDGGPCTLGLESTILDVCHQPPRILRAGPLFADQLSEVLGQTVLTPEQHSVSVAGNMPAHYQPNTPAQLMARATLVEALAQIEADQHRPVVLHYSAIDLAPDVIAKALPNQRRDYARQLYDAMAWADSQAGGEIWIERPPLAWLEVQDRLQRACYRE
ncbi:threonylcarbamoyl-AMP synthase [Aestuariibacter halophilus]|uniref:Threonylcarbamoyl-AMP synthase n=1 Tax=Fluctibacter halophilus TaxID=226011 RepID=A0ABS8GBQ5_9ALTE|nr:L-threonylcarbamoyladenylate synthase [Aestuariibacter halophilus]MCC2618014.1 threonylcarbamoyl-AMP synthase [Aestuariibacter halophilus]